jgi:chromosome segregation ATPase
MPVASPQQDYEQIQAERQRLEESRRRQQHEIDAHVKSITDIRASLEGKIVDFQRECEALQRVLRRSPHGEVGRHLVYQAAQMRMSGVLSQALKRAQAADKYLEAAKAEEDERASRERQDEIRDKVRAARREVASLQVPQDDDLDSLYEEVTDAP